MKYRIVYANFYEELEDLVNDLMEEGWEPLGGVAGVGEFYDFAQAMVKREGGEE